MQVVVITSLCTTAPAVMFERTVNVVSDLNLPALLTHQLLHPLAYCIVEIVCMNRRLGALGLSPEDLHLIRVVPFEVAGHRLRPHIAVGIEAVFIAVNPDLHATQA